MHALNIQIFVYILLLLLLLSAKFFIVILKRKRTTIHKVAFTVYKHHKTRNIQHYLKRTSLPKLSYATLNLIGSTKKQSVRMIDIRM